MVLGNFVQIMSDTCANQQLAENGDLVSLPRALLDTLTIAIATSSFQSSATASSPGSAATSAGASGSSSVSSSSSSASSTATAGAVSGTSTSTSSNSSRGLGAGAAAAGIGVGIGLVAAGAIAGFVLRILRRRKQGRQRGIFAPGLPAYSPAPPAKPIQEKYMYARNSPAVSELGHPVAVHEWHSHMRYEAGGAYHDGSDPVELDPSKTRNLNY